MGLKAHYEKIICACCFLFLCVNVGFPSTSFNVYQPYIVELVGDTNGSLVLAARTFISLICMVFVARYYKKFDCRLGIFMATMCTAAGFMVYSFTSSFAGMCVAAALTGAGYGLGGFSGMTLVIGRWYKQRVGMALGIASMGSGIASILIPIAATFVIKNVSLAWSFRLEALLALSIGLTVFALLRNRPPEDQDAAGSQAAQVAKGSAAEGNKVAVAAQPAAQRQTIAGSRRRLMQVAMFFLGCISVDGYGYLSVLMTSSGFDHYFAATLLSVCGLALTVSKFINGAIFDALGTRKGSAIFFILWNIGLVLCCMAGLGNTVIMAVAIVLMGVGTTLGSVGISMWCIDLSAEADRAKLVRDLQVAYATGGFLFNLVPGPLMDAVGTYTISYGILLAMCLACMAIVLTIYSRHSNKKPA